MTTTKRILIVDDEAAVLTALQRSLRLRYGRSLQVETQLDARVALERAKEQDFDLVISDLRMPAMDGVIFLRDFAGIRPHSVRMMLTGSADFETTQRAINDAGVFRYLCKPWQDEELATHIDAALAYAATLREQSIHAQAWHQRLDTPSAQELERRRLEHIEPGITRVEWGPNGEVLMPPLRPIDGV
jgi:two-component system probable response regulator PhcQ